jgi:riboflavin kinase/radical SAM family protein
MPDEPLFACRGRVRPGLRLGRALGAPTANIELDDPDSAPRGTFAAVVEGLDRPYAAVAHVGVRPSVCSASEPLLEAHLLDFEGDLYGREITVRLERKVSDEARLDSLESLAGKIAADIAAVRAYFAARGAEAGASDGSPDKGSGPRGRRRPTGRGAPRASFDRTPFMVFWEMTRACDLACKHCRADARPERDAGELGFEEGVRLLDEVQAMGCPLIVLTGGDPAKRPDLVDLVRHGARIGLRLALRRGPICAIWSESSGRRAWCACGA